MPSAAAGKLELADGPTAADRGAVKAAKGSAGDGVCCAKELPLPLPPSRSSDHSSRFAASCLAGPEDAPANAFQEASCSGKSWISQHRGKLRAMTINIQYNNINTTIVTEHCWMCEDWPSC